MPYLPLNINILDYRYMSLCLQKPHIGVTLSASMPLLEKSSDNLNLQS